MLCFCFSARRSLGLSRLLGFLIFRRMELLLALSTSLDFSHYSKFILLMKTWFYCTFVQFLLHTWKVKKKKEIRFHYIVYNIHIFPLHAKRWKKNTILLYDTIKLCFRYFLDGVGFRWRRRWRLMARRCAVWVWVWGEER